MKRFLTIVVLCLLALAVGCQQAPQQPTPAQPAAPAAEPQAAPQPAPTAPPAEPVAPPVEPAAPPVQAAPAAQPVGLKDKCAYLTKAEMESAIGKSFVTVDGYKIPSTTSCQLGGITSDMKGSVIIIVSDYSGRGAAAVTNMVKSEQCTDIVKKVYGATFSQDVGDATCTWKAASAATTNFVVYFAKGEYLVQLSANNAITDLAPLISLAKKIEPQLSGAAAAVAEAEPAGANTGLLEDGTGGLTKGTAGWANNIAIAKVKAKLPTAKLYDITSMVPGGTTVLGSVNADGTIKEGDFWQLQFRDDAGKGYLAKVYPTGMVELSERSDVCCVAVSGWKLNSDVLLQKARETKPGYDFSTFEVGTGGMGPTAGMSAKVGTGFAALALHAGTGAKIIETGFK